MDLLDISSTELFFFVCFRIWQALPSFAFLIFKEADTIVVINPKLFKRRYCWAFLFYYQVFAFCCMICTRFWLGNKASSWSCLFFVSVHVAGFGWSGFHGSWSKFALSYVNETCYRDFGLEHIKLPLSNIHVHFKGYCHFWSCTILGRGWWIETVNSWRPEKFPSCFSIILF